MIKEPPALAETSTHPGDGGAGGAAPASVGPASVGPGSVGTGQSLAGTAIAVAAWSLSVISTALLVLARPALSENLLFFVVDIAVACIYGTIAAVILRRRSHAVPWLLGLASIGGGLAAFGFAYDTLSAPSGGLPPVAWIALLQNTAWVPGTLTLFLVVPWLVRNHPLGRAWWGPLTGGLLVAAMTVVAGTEWQIFAPLLVLVIAFGVVTSIAVEMRRHHGPVDERNGLGWLALGTAILAVSFLPLLLPFGTLPIWMTPMLHLASQAVFPGAVLVAVLRNRMWGLGLVVSRAVLAGLLTTVLLGIYLGVSLLLSQLLPGDGVAQLVGAGAVAVAVQPLRLTMEGRVHRLVYGEGTDPARVVRRLGSQLVGSATPEGLVLGLVEDIGRSMRLESISVIATDITRAEWGTLTGEPTTVPLRHRGEVVGVLAVSAAPGEQLSSRDLDALRDASHLVAAAVAVVRAALDVEQMRQRLSQVRLEERRVIRREIHDGLGPALAGIRLGLQGARNLLESHPDDGKILLTQLQDEVDTAVSGVRSLSHHLLPPVLDELGLGAALTELALRYNTGEMEVVVVTDRFSDLDPPLAAAAYGIASEAATNAARHSGASTCWIEARATHEHVVLDVADDGSGMPVDAVAGVGSRSMRERAVEQEGRLEISARQDGGTVVRAILPWRARGDN